MKTRTKIFILFMILLLIVGNYYIYIERIKYEYWETQDLIFFLGILNGAMISLPSLIYMSITDYIDEEERKRLALLLVDDMIKRHEEEKQFLLDAIKYLEEENKQKEKTPKAPLKRKVEKRPLKISLSPIIYNNGNTI